jgi:hypothetical protein
MAQQFPNRTNPSENRQRPVANRCATRYDTGEGSGIILGDGCPFMFTTIVAFSIYWLVMFVLSYLAVEVGQDQLYDEATPMAGLKVAGGSLLLAVMLTYFHPRFDSMFTEKVASTVFQALIWIGVFILIYQFHPWHGLAIALPLMLLCSGFATMGVDSVTTPTPTLRRASSLSAGKPVRKAAAAAPSAAGASTTAPPVPAASKK